MRRRTAGLGVIAVLVGATACSADYACIQDDPAEYTITAVSAVDGAPLDQLSGAVVSGGYSRPLACFDIDGAGTCAGHASYMERADIRVDREGYQRWDSLNLRVQYHGDRCPRPATKSLVARMTPEMP